MSRHFNPQGFLNSAPNAMLREYFKRVGVLAALDWDKIGEYSTGPVFEALAELEDSVTRDDILHKFREIHRLSGPGFTKAILREAGFHDIDPDLSNQFDGMRSHLAKAFWTFLYRAEVYWTNALILYRIDRLPETQWHTCPNMPSRPKAVDEQVVEEWKQTLIEFFQKTEARGKKCEVRPLRIGSDEIFYAYPEDYKDTVSEFVGEQLQPRSIQPVFEVIVVQNDTDRTIRIYVEGDPTIAPKLKVAFAKCVLETDVSEEEGDDERAYELDQMLGSDFDFEWDDELDIAAVIIKSMRIKKVGTPWRRFTVEVDPDDGRRAVYDFLAETTEGMKNEALQLVQVTLRVEFSEAPNEATSPYKLVVLTAPNKCRLELDERSAAIHKMLQASGIERQSVGEEREHSE